jgi:hypothetical protein
MSKLAGIKIIVAALVFVGAMSSCKSKRKAQQSQTQNQTVSADTTTDKCKLDFKSTKTLTRLMKDQELKFNTVVAKFNCELSMNNDEQSFNVSVRCRKDSVIWMNVSKLGVDAVRMLITKDTVKFMVMTSLGGLDKGYFIGGYAFINQQLSADLDYDVIQALLFGNSADFLTDTVKLKGGKDRSNCQYFLSTIRKRRLQKLIEGQPPKESVQTMWLNSDTWKIAMLEYDDAETKRKFNSCYDDFQKVDSTQTAPFKLLYTITAEKIIKADIKYSKIRLNETTSFPFRIPDSYPKIELKKPDEKKPVTPNTNGSGN